MKKRLLSAFLTIAIVLSLAAVPVFAAGTWTELDAAGLKEVVCANEQSLLIYYKNDSDVTEAKTFISGLDNVTIYAYKAPAEGDDAFASMFSQEVFCPALAACGGTKVNCIPYALGDLMATLQQMGLYDPAVNSKRLMDAADEAACQAMLAMKSRYPEGMHWTNADEYVWLAPIYMGNTMVGGGCAAFGMILSDAAFGKNTPALDIKPFTYDQVRAGTMLRVNNDTHTVIVLEKYDDHVVVAEGNVNSSIHWGRVMTKADVMAADYITIRSGAAVTPIDDKQSADTTADPSKPADSEEPADKTEEQKPEDKTEEKPDDKTEEDKKEEDKKEEDKKEEDKKPDQTITITFDDVPQDSYYADAVSWAVAHEVTTGTNAEKTQFTPNRTCTRSEVVTFLWRAMDKPTSKSDQTFTDLTQDWYKDAVAWAVAEGITNGAGDGVFMPDRTCTVSEIITFIYRALNSLEASQGGEQFYSVAEKWVKDNDLSKDMGFELTGSCSRAMTVTYLFRGLTEGKN